MKENLLILGPLSLLEAVVKELDKIPFSNHGDSTGGPDYNGLVIAKSLDNWFTGCAHHLPKEAAAQYTLPQDWNKLMDILEELKKPKVPEYVKGPFGKVFKVSGHKNGVYESYNPFGKVFYRPDEEDMNTPITEEEFIQGGLKELEEAGFVKGCLVKAGSEGKTFKCFQPTYHKVRNDSSLAIDKEVKAKGFCFGVATQGGGCIPIKDCTLTLPTTSQGIPYLVDHSNVYLGPTVGGISTHVGTIKHWLKLGVQSITLDCGTLTRKDLQTIVGL